MKIDILTLIAPRLEFWYLEEWIQHNISIGINKIFCSKDINEKNIKMINRMYSEDFINCGYRIRSEKDDEK